MVHIDPATLRKYPIVGVLFGLVTGTVLVFLMLSGSTEARTLLGQKSPSVLSLHQAVNQEGIRWVTVSDGDWHCGEADTIPRQGILERWLSGPIEAIEVPITAGRHDELLVASFERAVSCVERANAPLTGVVGSVEVFTSRATIRRWSQAGKRVAVLNVGANPSEALVMLLGMCVLLLTAVLFCSYYLRLMLLQSTDRHRAPLPLSQPIEPR